MDSVTRILNIAEARMRRVGYNAVSFRDIATEMGLKSASLHYHFPKKADLGRALVRRYSKNFIEQIETRTRDMDDPAQRVSEFVSVYREALGDNQLICLCAMLGAENASLPDTVATEVRAFVSAQINWLTAQYHDLAHTNPKVIATTTLALLQGAMILSGVCGDTDPFEAAEIQIKAGL